MGIGTVVTESFNMYSTVTVSIMLLGLPHGAFSMGLNEERELDGPIYDAHQCGVYYAESTIPGAGYGLFAGKDFDPHDWVLAGDLVVPLVEIEWNNGHTSNYVHIWEDYQWSSQSFDGMDREGETASGASFGVGALPNCFAPFINIEETYTALDWAGVHRRSDPGAGAFTPYHDRKTYAYEEIEAGMELFVDYGSSYFPSRESIFGPVPLLEDYEYGDALLYNLIRLTEEIEHPSQLGDHPEQSVCSAEGGLCVSDTQQWRHELDSDVLAICHEVGVIWKSRPLLTLPENATHVDYLLEYGTRFLHYNRSVRSLEWLQEHGQCADNIRPGRSTIQQAGRGGFATRKIPAGALVAPVPLIQIANRSIYNMYGSYVDEDSEEHTLLRNESAVVGYQLLLNYCFGHRQSTILLCPYGVGFGLINHSQEKANAKVAWSTKGSRHLEWLDQPIDEWKHVDHTGLAFDLIALRDIAEGEEILIDYGDEWQAAWEGHVKQWQPPPGSDKYEPSAILNEMDDLVVRTFEEGPYHSEKDKVLYCREIYRQWAGALDESQFDFHLCRVLDRYVKGVNEDGSPIWHYMVETFTDVENKKECFESNRFIIFDMPRDGFNFRDALYSMDHSQPWAFRHDLRIPNEIMPDVWKNVPEMMS